jgi:hypothetical protein
LSAALLTGVELKGANVGLAAEVARLLAALVAVEPPRG